MRYTKEQQEAIKSLETEMQGKYLTEEWLGKILQVIYPGCTWKHDEKLNIKETTRRFRPDYYCPERHMCVEFDGPDHYVKSKVIQADIEKDNTLKSLGYKVIRIPYFIQLNTEAIKALFDIDVEFNYGFKHGFISRTVTLPSSFCELGVWRFKDDLYKFRKTSIVEEIAESIANKINSLKMPSEVAKLYVAPSSLFLELHLSNYDHTSENTTRIVKSNLKTNWNCVILEATQNLLAMDGMYDMRYEYDENGNISAYSYCMFGNGAVTKYRITLEKSLDNTYVRVTTTINDEVINSREYELQTVGALNFIGMIYG